MKANVDTGWAVYITAKSETGHVRGYFGKTGYVLITRYTQHVKLFFYKRDANSQLKKLMTRPDVVKGEVRKVKITTTLSRA